MGNHAEADFDRRMGTDEWVSRAKPGLNRRSLRPRRSGEEAGIYLGYTFRGQNIRATVTLTIFIGVSRHFIRAKMRACDMKLQFLLFMDSS
jgi:hypothetical protein